MSSRQPLVYGYMRVWDISDEDVCEQDGRMRAWAESEGFHLERIFCEEEPDSFRSFYDLVEALEETGAGLAVMPSFTHLSASVVHQSLNLQQIEFGSGAGVVSLDELEELAGQTGLAGQAGS